MYMDEKNSSVKPLFIRIILIVLALFILMIIFPTKGFVTNYVDKKIGNTSNFNNNLIAMATAGSGYFTKSRLPQNTNDKVKMTLKEMLDKKMITNLTDSSGVSCSTKKSYVEVTKKEDEYTMKVNLSCSEKEDYIVLHMGLDGTQFPSTSTARCSFVKNLDEAWSYGSWSSWSTNKIIEDGTNQVQTTTKKVVTGSKTVAKEQIETAQATKYNYNGERPYYICGSNYDNKGVYDIPTTCTKKTIIMTDEPTYTKVTYYRYRTKTLIPNSSDIKEANCDDQKLINEGYVKVN